MEIERKWSATKNEALGTLYPMDIAPGPDVVSSPRYRPFLVKNGPPGQVLSQISASGVKKGFFNETPQKLVEIQRK